jgi:hypothetical protein
MIRVFNIDDNEYKYEEVSISENYEEKQLLIDNSILTKIDSSLNYDTVKVRVADDKYQYIGLGRKEG